MRRVAVVASASGNGKTTVGRALAVGVLPAPERVAGELAAYPVVRLRTPAEVEQFVAAARAR